LTSLLHKNGSAHIAWFQKKTIDGSSEKANKIQILKKKWAGNSNDIKFCKIIKLQKHFMIGKVTNYRSLFNLIAIKMHKFCMSLQWSPL
jgi:hypothetical protein